METEQTYEVEEHLTREFVESFGQLTGDINPLHMDKTFANERGFSDQVVHGALLTSIFSRIIGMHLPGKGALIMKADSQFRAPTLIEDRVTFKAEMTQWSEATSTMVVEGEARHSETGKLLASFNYLVKLT